jgi:hypothetical protein
MEYNTTRSPLVIREYGRNIQKMIEYLLTIEDKEKRQRNAQAVIELMGTLNPHLRNVEDFRHKLWDHLFLISDFKLDVDSPYPKPTRESLKPKPAPLPYPKRHPRYSHLGKNLEMLIEKAIQEPDPDKRAAFAQVIGNYMKLAYNNWHKENIHDDMIRSELAAITHNQLDYQPGVPMISSGEPYRNTKRRFNKYNGKSGSFNKYHNKYKNRNK